MIRKAQLAAIFERGETGEAMLAFGSRGLYKVGEPVSRNNGSWTMTTGGIVKY